MLRSSYMKAIAVSAAAIFMPLGMIGWDAPGAAAPFIFLFILFNRRRLGSFFGSALPMVKLPPYIKPEDPLPVMPPAGEIGLIANIILRYQKACTGHCVGSACYSDVLNECVYWSKIKEVIAGNPKASLSWIPFLYESNKRVVSKIDGLMPYLRAQVYRYHPLIYAIYIICGALATLAITTGLPALYAWLGL